MSKINLNLGAVLKGLPLLLLCAGAAMLSSCDDDGLTAGDPNYFTSSRGQFTATLDERTTLFLLPGSTANTAVLTYDGDNPQHWQSPTNATVAVTTYTGDLVLPAQITADDGKTYTLTAIGDEAFMGCRTLTSVVLPETVQSFGEGAFAICRTLTTINIPEGITEIPNGCFGYCSGLNNFTLPSTVTKIDKMAFYGCGGIRTIVLPEGLKTIGEMAFSECNNSAFTEITIPASVTTIGNKAFGGRDSSSRSKIAAYHMQGTTPPTLEGVLYEAADGVEPVIYVPAGALSAYQSAPGWSSLNIEEE